MQSRELNHATFEVASSMDVSGRATAEEMNRGLRKSLGRITSLIILGSLMAAGPFVASTPMAAWADENERGGHKGIEALEAKVASLEQTVSALQSQVGSLQTSNATLQGQISTLQGQLAAVQSNPALALGPFVSVDPNPEIGVIGPNIIFSGANIHIVSGSGTTNDNGNPTGLGNLIIGYDEAPSFLPPIPGDRGGSHNLVIGSFNRFTKAAFGGLVAGEANTISNEAASVSGGLANTASGTQASVTGGLTNTASGTQASVTGGSFNGARGEAASVSGGDENDASGLSASITGGDGNTADGRFASISGGIRNIAGDTGNPSSGGSSISGGLENSTIGSVSSILGGVRNFAVGDISVILGGTNVTNNNANSIAPQPPFP